MSCHITIRSGPPSKTFGHSKKRHNIKNTSAAANNASCSPAGEIIHFGHNLGGLTSAVVDSSSRRVAWGFVSWGGACRSTARKTLPNVFERMSNYVEWIHEEALTVKESR